MKYEIFDSIKVYTTVQQISFKAEGFTIEFKNHKNSDSHDYIWNIYVIIWNKHPLFNIIDNVKVPLLDVLKYTFKRKSKKSLMLNYFHGLGGQYENLIVDKSGLNGVFHGGVTFFEKQINKFGIVSYTFGCDYCHYNDEFYRSCSSIEGVWNHGIEYDIQKLVDYMNSFK